MTSRGRCEKAILNPALGELCRLRRKVPACVLPSWEARAAKGRALDLPSGGSRCSLHQVFLGVPWPCRSGCLPTLFSPNPTVPKSVKYTPKPCMAPQGHSALHRGLGEQMGSSTPCPLMVPMEYSFHKMMKSAAVLAGSSVTYLKFQPSLTHTRLPQVTPAATAAPEGLEGNCLHLQP